MKKSASKRKPNYRMIRYRAQTKMVQDLRPLRMELSAALERIDILFERFGVSSEDDEWVDPDDEPEHHCDQLDLSDFG